MLKLARKFKDLGLEGKRAQWGRGFVRAAILSSCREGTG